MKPATIRPGELHSVAKLGRLANNTLSEGSQIMTLLGAVVYAGFFALAALWLSATNPDAVEERAQSKRPERSNSVSVAAGPVGSSPCCATQSSQK